MPPLHQLMNDLFIGSYWPLTRILRHRIAPLHQLRTLFGVAIKLKSVFDLIQAAEKAGNQSLEEKKRLEEQAAAKKMSQALFKGTKQEVAYILRETCDRPPLPFCYTTRKGPVEGCGTADP
ncbi:uncharacterized protein LACBIDRAFT_295952 [Laccaria bicolor S238N-H82]|uniref:Predicted protein n=1 Tax=Laccaria bicolor (strain S238N-H82 / ATCC MYA-4686) TaxID=486041 RepID=B0E0V5_LACBS|nr:uncharacterized protein LACBIDRAFT_295952 [Laccaria bicolor S238N-H82]EDQ99512.1 predicted protein [Laccaria bicolor S238N-H82]|eukprot:XP_001889861.1 predicted protein [Laccaria bicolor S238N-H82]